MNKRLMILFLLVASVFMFISCNIDKPIKLSYNEARAQETPISPKIEEQELRWKTKVLEIGDWNMHDKQWIEIPHGLGEKYKDIRLCFATIRSDGDFPYYYNLSGGITNTDGTVFGWDNTSITLYRIKNGTFYNSTWFKNISYNRGWIYIQYIDGE